MDNDYTFLEKRLLRNMPINIKHQKWSSAPIIVSNNDMKDSLNIEAAKAFALHLKQSLHYYYATDKCKGKIITKPELRNKLWSYHSGKTEQHLGALPLCKDMAVMITQNYDVENGIVNGCMGIVKKTNYTVDVDGYRHAHSCIISTMSTTGPQIIHLQEHEIATLEDETSLTFIHPHSHLCSTFKCIQLPVTPAFCLTGHKSQGSTSPSAILDIESCLSTEADFKQSM